MPSRRRCCRFSPSWSARPATITALEPSAGIGRFVHAFRRAAGRNSRWTAIELSPISASLLGAVRPDIQVVNAPFEQWVVDNKHLLGTHDLVVSNPPYGIRGKFASIDREKGYGENPRLRLPDTARHRRTTARRHRRLSDSVGICVRHIGRAAHAARARALRAHFMGHSGCRRKRMTARASFRGTAGDRCGVSAQPRRRDPRLPEADDQYIAEGRYFEQTPQHILGREVGREGDDDDADANAALGLSGARHLPRVAGADRARSVPRVCGDAAEARREEEAGRAARNAAHALALARRVAGYPDLIARGDSDAIAVASTAYPELLTDLTAWLAQPTEERREALKFAGMSRPGHAGDGRGRGQAHAGLGFAAQVRGAVSR